MKYLKSFNNNVIRIH